MIAIATSNSISVKPACLLYVFAPFTKNTILLDRPPEAIPLRDVPKNAQVRENQREDLKETFESGSYLRA